MNEIKPAGEKAQTMPGDLRPSPAGMPVEPGKMPVTAGPEPEKTPEAIDENGLAATQAPLAPLAPVEIKAKATPKKHPLLQLSPGMVFVFLGALVLLLVVAAVWISRSRKAMDARGAQTVLSGQEEKTAPGGDASALSKNLLNREPKSREIILTDDAFAGQAPRSFKASGPVISQDIDPQLAALADAFRRRLDISQGSQWTTRGKERIRVTKGEYHGFRINAIEKVMDQKTAFSEITIVTPKRGYIQCINRVLEIVKETDFSRFAVEIQAAGLDFFMLPSLAGEKIIRMQLRSVRFAGKPQASESLISGTSVGGISLGMPIGQMEKTFIESHVVLKRKILVNDVYFDVYKLLDQSNEPLFYVYENKGKVWGISLISEMFKTERGVGIGSSLGMIRTSYPFIKLGYSEKKTPFVQLEGAAGLFIIQGDGIDFAKKVFPNENKVISILVGESPEFE